MQVRAEFSHMGCPWAVREAVGPLQSVSAPLSARPASGGGDRGSFFTVSRQANELFLLHLLYSIKFTRVVRFVPETDLSKGVATRQTSPHRHDMRNTSQKP